MALRNWIYAAAGIAGIARTARLVKSSYGSIRRIMQSTRHIVYIQSAVVVEGLIYTAGPMYAMPVHGSHYISPDMLRLECLRAMKRCLVTYMPINRGGYIVRVLNRRESDGDHDDVSKAGLSRTDMENVHGYELALRKFIASHRSGFTYNAIVDAHEAVRYSGYVDRVKELYHTASRQGRKCSK